MIENFYVLTRADEPCSLWDTKTQTRKVLQIHKRGLIFFHSPMEFAYELHLKIA